MAAEEPASTAALPGVPVRPGRLSRAVAAVLDGPAPRAALWLFALSGLVYVLTAAYTGPLSPDPIAAAMPAWSLAHTGSPYLEGTGLTSQWFGTAGGHLVSNRFAGVVWFGVPFYAVLGWLGALVGATGFTLAPAALAGATAAAGTVALVYLLMRELVAARLAMLVSLVFAFGTPTWSISANSLWPHGPAQLWLSAGLLLAVRRRYAWSGLVLGLAVATRLHFAVAALVLGVWLALSRRSLRPLVGLGLSAWALPVLLVWNHWVFGRWSFGGGYESHFAELAPASFGPWRYAINVAGTLAAPDMGLLFWSPVLIFLVAGLGWAWRRAPDWARAAPVAGLAYLAVQLQLNGFTGGMNFYGYRLALEAVTLAVPLLALAVTSPLVWGTARRTALVVAAGLQVTIIAVGAILPLPFLWSLIMPWTVWEPAIVMEHSPLGAVLIVAVGLAGTAWAVRLTRR